MNRRHFLKISTLSGLILSRQAVASISGFNPVSDWSGVMERFVTPYTDCVGHSILRSGRYAAVIAQLRQRLRQCGELDPEKLYEVVNAAIDHECQTDDFWEIEGWVVTPAETLLSAVLVQDVTEWK